MNQNKRFKNITCQNIESKLVNTNNIIINNTPIEEWFVSTPSVSYLTGQEFINTNEFTKQIITPDDLSNDKKHIYKHVLNNKSLRSVVLNNQNFNNIRIHTLKKNPKIISYNSNYNTISNNNKYTHNSNNLEFIDIYNESGFHPYTFGYLIWDNKYIQNYFNIEIDNNVIELFRDNNSLVLYKQTQPFYFNIYFHGMDSYKVIRNNNTETFTSDNIVHINNENDITNTTYNITINSSYYSYKIVNFCVDIKGDNFITYGDSDDSLEHSYRIFNNTGVPLTILIVNVDDQNVNDDSLFINEAKTFFVSNSYNVQYIYNSNIYHITNRKSNYNDLNVRINKYVLNSNFNIDLNSFSNINNLIPFLQKVEINQLFIDIENVVKLEFDYETYKSVKNVKVNNRNIPNKGVYTISPHQYQNANFIIIAENGNSNSITYNFSDNNSHIYFINSNTVTYNSNVRGEDLYFNHYHPYISSNGNQNSILNSNSLNSFSVSFLSFKKIKRDDITINYTNSSINIMNSNNTSTKINDYFFKNLFQLNFKVNSFDQEFTKFEINIQNHIFNQCYLPVQSEITTADFISEQNYWLDFTMYHLNNGKLLTEQDIYDSWYIWRVDTQNTQGAYTFRQVQNEFNRVYKDIFGE